MNKTILLNDKSIISSQELNKHNVIKYEFKSISNNPETQEDKPSSLQNKSNKKINNSFENGLLEKLLLKSDYLTDMINNFQMQFEALQARMQEMQRAFGDITDKNLSANLVLENNIKDQKESITNSVAKLDSTIENIKNQILSLESNLVTISLDIAKKVIAKEVSESSSKIAASIANEILRSLSGNLNITIKVNPEDFEFLNNLAKNKANINIESDNAVKKGGVVVVGENISIDGNIMSRYQLLKQSIFENVK